MPDVLRLDGSARTANFVENAGPVLLWPDITITATSPTLASVVLIVNGNFAWDLADEASAKTDGTNIVAEGLGISFFRLSGIDSLAHYQQVLRSIAIDIPGDTPSEITTSHHPGARNTKFSDRQITWQASDGTNSSAVEITTLIVTEVNDPPVNRVPEAQVVISDAGLAIPGLSISDPDAGGPSSPSEGVLATTLSVGHGTLAIAAAAGALVTGSGTATVTLTGTIAQIDTTLVAPNNVFIALWMISTAPIS
jgi:hypothetical protein